jgi:SAM-dependent methyltransferase
MVDQDSIPSRIWASNFSVSHRVGHSVLAVDHEATDDVAEIYNQAGDDYIAYADGDPSRPFAFNGTHAYADRSVWAMLETRLIELRASGASSVRFLDAGCGPGTAGRGSTASPRVDLTSPARLAARNLSSLPGVDLIFDIADLTDRLPELDASVDITFCLYSALSHLPVASLTNISAEIARVTSGHFITTVRPIGSTPTAFVEPVENVRRLKQDHVADRCEIDLSDGRRMAFGFHLFTAAELRDHEDLLGLDLFHSRFMPDPRWNPLSPPSQSARQTRAA